MAVDFKSALAFQDELRGLLKRHSSVDMSPDSRKAREAAAEAIIAAVAAKGGTLTDRWDGARISLYGLRASSTSGIAGACQNWLAQLTLKAATASMAGAQ